MKKKNMKEAIDQRNLKNLNRSSAKSDFKKILVRLANESGFFYDFCQMMLKFMRTK